MSCGAETLQQSKGPPFFFSKATRKLACTKHKTRSTSRSSPHCDAYAFHFSQLSVSLLLLCGHAAMILPLAKLGTLAIRTLSKPLASRVKAQATRHERFRQLIENFAQANHKFTVNVQRRLYGHATNVEIRPLDPEKAVQAAADLVGELVVFSVGVGVVIFEVQRSARAEARKEEARIQELEAISQRLQSLEEKFDQFVKGKDWSLKILPFRSQDQSKSTSFSPPTSSPAA